jgi:hypothetical protein
MCGGDLAVQEGMTVAECEYCGTKQTVPTVDNEKKITLFGRAGRLLRACEFDKAAGVFESIVAEFPEEAEAYWGLVLCKFGIEYVDDPATGKKVPTCHRSSFDSIFDDSNFEQACENADVVARGVYRSEAKAIEDLRKGIIEVSAKEEPYDVFISYKEKDESGERTIDSVIAQDIYTELTYKGYRVFFSRISLEDKLGVEYEPYIFAALNSAKLMLVVGTNYDNFEAVWVKNEWSRFLSLMASGQKKTLIPCFKDIDAYDMPKEFNKLAAQDMGKVGAMQDLVRGVEKILGGNKETGIKETVVVHSEGDMKTAAAVKRGNMALEDGDWEKADEHFEQALTLDAECAEAYVGKVLVGSKCHTLDEYTKRLIDILPRPTEETLTAVQPDRKRIQDSVARNIVKGYLNETQIRDLYAFNLKYTSTLNSLRKQEAKEQQRFWSSKYMSRAKSFASGEYLKTIELANKKYLELLAARTAEREKLEQSKIEDIKLRYAKHLEEMDTESDKESIAAKERREQDYQKTCSMQNAANTEEAFENAARDFANLNDYKDSTERAEACRKEAERIKADNLEKQRAEQERKMIAEAEAKLAAERAGKKNRKIATICAISAVIVLAFTILFIEEIIPGNRYSKATTMWEEGDYNSAAEIFQNLGDYKDADQKLLAVKYDQAEAMANTGDYDGAIANYTELADYEDAADKLNDAKCQKAAALLTEGNYSECIVQLEEVRKVDGNDKRIKETMDKAVAAVLNETSGDLSVLTNISDDYFKENITACYALTEYCINMQDWRNAMEYAKLCGDYELAPTYFAYAKAKHAYDTKTWETAVANFKAVVDFMDSEELLSASIDKWLEEYSGISLSNAISALETLKNPSQEEQELLQSYKKLQECEGTYVGYQKINRYNGTVEQYSSNTTLSFYLTKGVLYLTAPNKFSYDAQVLSGSDGYDYYAKTDSSGGCYFSAHKLMEDNGHFNVIYYFTK